MEPRLTRGVRRAVFACWLVGALFFAALPQNAGIRNALAEGLYYGAAGFVSRALARAVAGTRGR